MTNDALLALYDQQIRVEIEHPGARKEGFGGPGQERHIVRFVRPAPQVSMVLYSRIDPARLDDEIAAQVADFRAGGLRGEWIVYEHDQPPELPARLEAHGFRSDGTSPILYLDLHAAPAELREALPHPGLRRVTRREELDEVVAVMHSVYGGSFDWMYQRLGGHLEIPNYLSMYVLREHVIPPDPAEPACAAWIYFYPNSDFAGLWGGSTVKKFRGRGLYTAALAARVQEAIRRGYRYLFLDASEMSEPIVKRFGFQELTRLRAFSLED